MFKDAYKDKKVLITGHTGFKGSWLSAWLKKMGANVVGYSKDIPTQPAAFDVMKLDEIVKTKFGDVCSLEEFSSYLNQEKPDFIFHLAAQPIVSTSYDNPTETFMSNTIGTMNILEALRKINFPCITIMITSDKCYDNVEWIWGYRESDAMGGKDIYSGSKGAAEIVIKSYFHSFLKECSNIKIATGRAGNVIGGGDWAKDRLVADIYRAWSVGEKVEVRSPQATRPWQHVLEPLSGYLWLGLCLLENDSLNGETFNFGPRAEQNRTVIELLEDLGTSWGFDDPKDAYSITDNIPFHEAGLLKLNCDKALAHLKWDANLSYSETVRLVGDWYAQYYKHKSDIKELTINQIEEFEEIAQKQNKIWS